jgi:hypothetical protein
MSVLIGYERQRKKAGNCMPTLEEEKYLEKQPGLYQDGGGNSI